MATPADILANYIESGARVAGRYVIDRRIGAGAYGAIYLAFDEEEHREVAIKALPPSDEVDSETALGRFERELKVVANLHHPNIVEVFDYGETDDAVVFMAMEYVEGRTLDELVEDEGPLELDQALALGRQIAAALHAAHEKGVVHRDLKPANIMIERGPAGRRVKILDFGLAKLVAKLGGESIVALTREGMAVGTPRYISPEQARGSQRIGPWSDLYAVGLLIYEMAVGRKAVQHDSVESAVAVHVDDEPLELPGIEHLPEEVQDLIRGLVAKPIEERYDDAEKVVSAIDRLADNPNLGGRSPEEMEEMLGPPLGAEEYGDDVGNVMPVSERTDAVEKEGAFEDPDESIDLDWEEYKRAPGRRDEDTAVRRWREGSTTTRLVDGALYGLSGLAALLVLLVAFVFLTAQFSGIGGMARVVLGAVPAGFTAYRVVGSRGFARLRRMVYGALWSGGVGVAIAHLLGPVGLAESLWKEPAWFLAPLEEVPPFGVAADVLGALGRSYAVLLVTLFGEAGTLGA